MKLPVELKHTMHKHGGRIVRITAIGHEANKPQDGYSRDGWWFVGDVDWFDGTKSDGIEIAPWAACYDEGNRTEVDALGDLLMEYLLANGDWYGPKSGHQGWYANERPKVRRRA